MIDSDEPMFVVSPEGSTLPRVSVYPFLVLAVQPAPR
jgi:hypothetical protein